MGFLSEIKKLLFAKKSVAKSAARKSKDYVVDKAEDLEQSAKEFAKDAGSSVKEKTSGLRDSIMDTTGSIVDKGKEAWDDISEKVGESEIVKKAADISENVGDKILDAGEKTVDYAKDISEKVGEQVLDKGEDFMEKAKDISESVGEKVLDVKDDLMEKARKMTADLGEKLDETIEKAEKMAEEEAATPKKDFADETLDTGDSLLSGTDDFFEKAARFADGDYSSALEGKTTIIESKEVIEKKPPAKAAGFEDLDGDGNEMIDDAIISEEE
jgi:gas vesicle protein